jgi:hypothetical protein
VKVVIHGQEWEVDHIKKEVIVCRQYTWERKKWVSGPVLVHKKSGRISQFHGQKYDPTTIDYIENGWTHDHCYICYWTLSDSEDETVGTGYTDGGDWLCTECYERFVKGNEIEFA